MFYERCQTCSKSALTLPRGLDFANLAEAWLRGDEALVAFSDPMGAADGRGIYGGVRNSGPKSNLHVIYGWLSRWHDTEAGF